MSCCKNRNKYDNGFLLFIKCKWTDECAEQSPESPRSGQVGSTSNKDLSDLLLDLASTASLPGSSTIFTGIA